MTFKYSSAQHPHIRALPGPRATGGQRSRIARRRLLPQGSGMVENHGAIVASATKFGYGSASSPAMPAGAPHGSPGLRGTISSIFTDHEMGAAHESSNAARPVQLRDDS